MNRNFTVICTECSKEHSIGSVKFLNVEENMQGQDIMYFNCPVTGSEAKSLVYATTYWWESHQAEASDDYDGQPNEAQEWHDFDPDC